MAEDTKDAVTTEVVDAKTTDTAADTTKTTGTGAGTGDKKAGAETKAEPLAAGTDDEGKEGAATWPSDWRQRLAGKDKAALTKLERFKSPEDIFTQNKNLEKKLNEKAAPKPKPTEADELKAWRAERGVPEKAEGYIEALKLSDGKVLGDADKPMVMSFAEAMHAADVPPEVVSRGVDWYYKEQERIATAQAEADAKNKVEARDMLRDEYGTEFKANINSIGTLFTEAPEGMMDRVLAGRTSDGKMFGDDPEVVKWLVRIAKEANPEATMVGKYGGKSPSDRLEEISKLRKEKPQEYEQNRNKLEAEEIELLDAKLARDRRGKRAA